MINGSRTICFLRSRRGIELIQRFTRMRLEELGEPGLAARIAPYRAGYTPQQRREIEAELAARRAARGRRHRRARARDRHRRARRGDLRHLPGHRRQPAADVGPRRAAHARGSRSTSPARTRSTSSSAATPRSSSARRSRRRSSTTRTSGSRPRTCSPPPTRRRSAAPASSPAARDDEILGARWRERADALVGRRASCAAAATAATCRAGPAFRPGEISLRSASLDSVAVVDARSGELIGQVEAERAFTTVHPGAIYLHLGRSYEVARARRRRRGGRSSTPSTATGTRSRRRRPRSSSRRSARSARSGRGPAPSWSFASARSR